MIPHALRPRQRVERLRHLRRGAREPAPGQGWTARAI